ncbi:putative methyltransferase DDB_G0268948 [Lingula anatina]|uniref:Methyltransferase DDB_G0268948 n=1 Tax=Lingula anatina TaxID=7574 RepID=A0A2R2MQB7_LINAN|nr:putative methyltransferase DDB_G0268948 [Lingula anatina]|eukprot:XP_023932436.1 putative methyltransferase DDB_G0268948 [Lingula anatina]
MSFKLFADAKFSTVYANCYTLQRLSFFKSRSLVNIAKIGIYRTRTLYAWLADHTATYAKFRSFWTTDITDRVLTYLQERYPAPYDHAIDVGCGSGQFTQLLAPHCKQVTGIDISANQISEAIKGNDRKNITYKVGAAECFPIADQSVELVTCVQAAHFIDMDKF